MIQIWSQFAYTCICARTCVCAYRYTSVRMGFQVYPNNDWGAQRNKDMPNQPNVIWEENFCLIKVSQKNNKN